MRRSLVSKLRFVIVPPWLSVLRPNVLFPSVSIFVLNGSFIVCSRGEGSDVFRIAGRAWLEGWVGFYIASVWLFEFGEDGALGLNLAALILRPSGLGLNCGLVGFYKTGLVFCFAPLVLGSIKWTHFCFASFCDCDAFFCCKLIEI